MCVVWLSDDVNRCNEHQPGNGSCTYNQQRTNANIRCCLHVINVMLAICRMQCSMWVLDITNNVLHTERDCQVVWDDGLRDVSEPRGLVHLQRAGSSETGICSGDCIMVDGLHSIVCVRWTPHILLRDRVHPDVSGGTVPGRDLSVLFLNNLSHLHVCLQTALLSEAQQQDGSVVLWHGVATLHCLTDNDGEGLSSVLDYRSHKQTVPVDNYLSDVFVGLSLTGPSVDFASKQAPLDMLKWHRFVIIILHFKW